MYEDTLKKYQELQIQHRKTVKNRKDLDIKHDDLDNKYKHVVKKYEQLVQQLKDKVECPVCLVVPNKAPIPVCPNGHVVCSKCKREDCPKCRVKMAQGKSTLAITVIENLDHLCDNEGCQEIIPFEGLANHGKSCNYRLVACPSPFWHCRDMVSLSSLAIHMVSSSCFSSAKIEVSKLPVQTRLTYNRDGSSRDKTEWKPFPMRFGQQTFVLRAARYKVNGNGRWFFLVQMVGGAEETSQYRVTITVHRTGDGMEGNYSQIYRGDVCPIDVTLMEDAEEKGLCLLLTDNAMGKILVEESDKMRFSVSVNLFGTDPAMF